MICQKLLDRIAHVPTENMGYEEWLEKRMESIGGSDAGAIMGFGGKYGSPLTVFLQKKGLEKSKDMSPAAKRGKLLEPLIRDWFAEAYPAAVIEKVPYMFRPSGDYQIYQRKNGELRVPSFMSANIDGLIFTETPIKIGNDECVGLGGLEIKSSRDGYDFGEDEIPDSYFAQVQHYMAVLNLEWFIVSVAILSREEIVNYIIPRDDEFITRDLIEAETKFWNKHILTNIWPAALGIEGEEAMITGMYKGAASTLDLTEEEKALCQQITELKAQIKPLQERKEAAEIDLKAKLGSKAKTSENERRLYAIGGPFSVTWLMIDSPRVDTDALKKDGLYDQYRKVLSYPRLDVKMIKKE
jgi:predicted phage-related endonuclease